MGAGKDVSVEEMEGSVSRNDFLIIVVCLAILVWLLPIVAAA